MKILASFEKQNKSLLILEGFLLIGIIGIVDYFTGDLGFSVFYVLPIFLITWFTNQRVGLAASVVCAIIWFAADITTTQPFFFSFIQIWNSFIRLAFFIIITILLSALKSSLELARTDHLTTAINARYFYDLTQMEMNRAQRNQHPFTIAYIDLDNFKAVNDQFGHVEGDRVLIALVSSVGKVIRKSDFIARLGGDEFAILFPETDQESARIIFSKIQNSFAEAVQQKKWPVTFSVGILTCRVAPQTTDELIRIADELMYQAKYDGKNTVKYSIYNGY